jgi:hypothetical protein
MEDASGITHDFTGLSYAQWIEACRRALAECKDLAFDLEYYCADFTLLEHCIHFLQEPEGLFDLISNDDKEKWCWWLPRPYGFLGELSRDDVNSAMRREAVHAIEVFFIKALSSPHLDVPCFMWWDTFGWFPLDPRNVDIARCDVLPLLGRLLGHTSRNVRRSAIHGIGHLANGDLRADVERMFNGVKFFREDGESDVELDRYLAHAVRGDVE